MIKLSVKGRNSVFEKREREVRNWKYDIHRSRGKINVTLRKTEIDHAEYPKRYFVQKGRQYSERRNVKHTRTKDRA